MDWDRRWRGLFPRFDAATTYTDDLPKGPDTEQQVPEFEPRDLWAKGSPMGYSSYRYFQGRYGDLNADPVFRFGWDIRSAVLVSRQSLAFPMQADLALAVHPAERFTVLVNVGARGRTSGIGDVVDDPSTPYLREGFVLVHELPYRAYAKAGRFVPAFGLRLDDHTSFIRRQFDLDSSLPESRVTGVEIGASPNYPSVNLSVFRTNKTAVSSAFDLFDTGDGSGMALNAGYRELGWSLGASFMTRDQSLGGGARATTFGVYGVVNPWFYKRSLPLTYQAEVDYGKADRPGGSTEAAKMAVYHELDWLAGNGLNFLVKHDWEEPDTEVKDDEAHRVSAGVQFTPVPGVTVDGRFRVLMPAGGETGTDFFLQLHLWN
jgi:hypothetical protein